MERVWYSCVPSKGFWTSSRKPRRISCSTRRRRHYGFLRSIVSPAAGAGALYRSAAEEEGAMYTPQHRLLFLRLAVALSLTFCCGCGRAEAQRLSKELDQQKSELAKARVELQQAQAEVE